MQRRDDSQVARTPPAYARRSRTGLTPFEDCAYQREWPGCTVLTYLLRGSLNRQALCKSMGVSCRDSDAGWSVAGPAGNQVVALRPTAIFHQMHDVDGDRASWSEEARQTKRAGSIQQAADTTVDKDMGWGAMRYETKKHCQIRLAGQHLLANHSPRGDVLEGCGRIEDDAGASLAGAFPGSGVVDKCSGWRLSLPCHCRVPAHCLAQGSGPSHPVLCTTVHRNTAFLPSTVRLRPVLLRLCPQGTTCGACGQGYSSTEPLAPIRETLLCP